MSPLLTSKQAYDWSKDPNAAGAFALFSPGNFSEHYPSLITPASDSRFFIVGEAASAHHAWIVGALDSAMRGVCQMLTRFGLTEERKRLEDEFRRVDELDEDTIQQQIALGMLTKEEQPRVPLVPMAAA